LSIAAPKTSNTISLRGWTIALSCLLAQFFGNGMVAIFGVFLLPISGEFGVGMSQMSLGMVIYILVTCLVSPIIGGALKPGRIKPIMLSGAVLMAVSMSVLSMAASVTVLAAGMVLLSISFSLYGAIPSTVIIAQWYDLKRGRALAVMAMGISVAGFTLPPLSAWLLESFGWRAALMSLGLSGAIILLAAFHFLVEEKTGSADETVGAILKQETLESEPDDSSQAVTKKPSFWLIGSSFGVINTTLILSGIFFIPYLQTLGLSAVEAAGLIAVGGVTGLIGKIIIGWMSDHLRSRAITLLVLLQLSLIVCWYALTQVQDYSHWVFLLVAVMGMAQGGTIPLQPYINSHIFGVERVGKVTGLHAAFLLPFILPAAPLVGKLIDDTGSYNYLFFSCTGLLAIALVLTLRIEPIRA